jgi:dihydroorotase
LPYNTERITLEKTTVRVPQELPFGPDRLVPFRGGEAVAWRIL